MRPFLLFAFTLVTFSATCQLQQFTINFQNDEFTLDEEDITEIASAIEFTSSENIRIISIKIYGYADTNGSGGHNVDLSKKRANAVADKFKPGLDNDLLSVLNVNWYGEESHSSSGQNLNYATRSVDILIQFEKVIEQKESISALFEKLYTPVQRFHVNPNLDTVIVGEYGTIVMIPANSFYIPKSCMGEQIEIRLQESYDPASFVLNNLSTTDHGTQLESAGMVFVKAYGCDRILTPRESANFTVLFPADTLLEGMNLYGGSRDKSGSIKWNISKRKLRSLNSGDVDKLLGRWRFLQRYEKSYCPFFFCRIQNYFNPGEDHSFKYRYYRRNSAAYRKYIDSMCTVFGVRNENALFEAMEKQRKEKLAASFENGEVKQWSYYAADVNQLGWMNCDRFLDLPEKQLSTVVVAQDTASNVSVNLLFAGYRSMMSAGISPEQQYQFANVAIGQRCYVISMKYENNTPYLSVQNIVIKKGMVIEPEYREYTIEGIKAELSKIGT